MGSPPFSILVFQHRHFGPRLAGPLRLLFPSPLQSNWRLYLASPLPGAPDCPTVVFVRNIFDRLLHALVTRVCSDVLPSHLARRFSFRVDAAGASIAIDPGAGSSPLLTAQFERFPAPILPSVFAPFAPTWIAAAARLASQDAAVAPVHHLGRTAFGTISLPIDVPSIEPLHLLPGTLQCPLLHELGAREESLSFLLPRVYFQALSERLL